MSATPELKRLWEVDHSYYCSDSNFYKNDVGQRYDSWADWIGAWDSADLDMNLLFRWDWIEPDPADYTLAPSDGETPLGPQMWLFYILQRKGIYMPHMVCVTRDDEPAIRSWLQPRMAHIVDLWAPLSVSV